VASSRLQSESRYAQALYMQWFFQQVVLQNAANSENVADPRVSKLRQVQHSLKARWYIWQSENPNRNPKHMT